MLWVLVAFTALILMADVGLTVYEIRLRNKLRRKRNILAGRVECEPVEYIRIAEDDTHIYWIERCLN